MRIGTQLKAWRDAKRLNQQQAALVVGISQGTWSDLESDKVGPRADTLVKLVKHEVLIVGALLSQTGAAGAQP